MIGPANTDKSAVGLEVIGPAMYSDKSAVGRAMIGPVNSDKSAEGELWLAPSLALI